MISRFIVVTFYSEGSPWDAGISLVDEERQFRAAVEPYVDEVRSYCPRTLSALWPGSEKYHRDYTEWLESHLLRGELRHYHPNWARLGFQGWKPFLLQSVLNDDSILTGDVIFYHDVNFRKYPAFSRTPAEWRDVSLRILDDLGCDIFSPEGGRLEADAKAFLVRRYLHESVGLERGVRAGLILLRKSKQSIDFVNEWKTLCDDLDNIAPLPNPKPYAGAIWHAPEQSTLSVLALRWKHEGRLPAEWPLYAAGDLSYDLRILYRKVSPPTAWQRRLYRVYLSLPASLQSALITLFRGGAKISRRIRGR